MAKRDRLKIIFLGKIGKLPFAGMAWEALQYLEGLRRLGHDVYYIEDTLEWPYMARGVTSPAAACRTTAAYISRMMAWCGMSDQWAYKAEAQKGRLYGLSEAQFARAFDDADVLINWGIATFLHDRQLEVPVRIYLQTDPGTNDIHAAQGDPDTLELIQAHTHFFSWAENLGAPDCGLPTGPVTYHPTRQPIVLDWFASDAGPSKGSRRTRGLNGNGHPGCAGGNGRGGGHVRFTTVSSWKQTGNNVEWQGETYTWSKHYEFLKFIDLPRHVGATLELALACDDVKAKRLLRSHGWRVVDGLKLTSGNILPYRDYLAGSSGEFTVAKDQNVRLRSGWFSDRSAAYLACGKPVITQNTGFDNILPTGQGLFAFTTMSEAVAAFDAIDTDYERHSRAAHEIAVEYFRAEDVLGRMLDKVG